MRIEVQSKENDMIETNATQHTTNTPAAASVPADADARPCGIRRRAVAALASGAASSALVPELAWAADGKEMATKLVSLGSVALVVVGVCIIVNALYQMSDEKSKSRPSDGSEWWTLAKGGVLVIVGGSTYLIDLFGLLSVL